MGTSKGSSLLREIREVAERVDAFIHENFKAFPDFLQKACLHTVKAGGKRLRPFLVVKSCEICGGSSEKALPAAAAIELIHTFTLVHDDIMDRGEIRRGAPSVFVKWGIPVAILAGDLLFSRALEVFASCSLDPSTKFEVMAEMARVTSSICEGQAMDLSFTRPKEIPKEGEYIEMISKKTASLFASCCKIGAVIARADEKYVQALTQYGFSLGLAFQIVDDVLNIVGTEEELGKPVASDIREGKATLPVIKTLEKKPELHKLLLKEALEDSEVEQFINAIRECGALDECRSMAKAFVEEAKRHLEPFPASRTKALLLQLADFIVERRY